MPSNPTDATSTPATDRAELLRQALRQTHRNLAIASLMLAALIAAGIYAYCFTGRLVEAKEEKLLAAVKEELATHAGRLTQRPVIWLAKPSRRWPGPLASACKTTCPCTCGPSTNGQPVGRCSGGRIRNKVEKRAEDYVAQHRNILQEEFPEITNQLTLDRMTTALEKAVNRMAQHYYVDEFREQVARLVQLWDSTSPLPAGKPPDKELQQMLASSLTEWLLLQVSEGGSPLSVGKRSQPRRRRFSGREGGLSDAAGPSPQIGFDKDSQVHADGIASVQ